MVCDMIPALLERGGEQNAQGDKDLCNGKENTKSAENVLLDRLRHLTFPENVKVAVCPDGAENVLLDRRARGDLGGGRVKSQPSKAGRRHTLEPKWWRQECVGGFPPPGTGPSPPKTSLP